MSRPEKPRTTAVRTRKRASRPGKRHLGHREDRDRHRDRRRDGEPPREVRQGRGALGLLGVDELLEAEEVGLLGLPRLVPRPGHGRDEPLHGQRRVGEADARAPREEVDDGEGDARHLPERRLDPPHAGGAVHPLHRELHLGTVDGRRRDRRRAARRRERRERRQVHRGFGSGGALGRAWISGRSATAYAIAATAAAALSSEAGSILSNVSSAVWWKSK